MKVCVRWYEYCGENKSGKRRAMLGKVILILVLGSDRLHEEGDSSATFRWKGGAWYTPGGKPIGKGTENTNKDKVKEYFKTLQNTVFEFFRHPSSLLVSHHLSEWPEPHLIAGKMRGKKINEGSQQGHG